MNGSVGSRTLALLGVLSVGACSQLQLDFEFDTGSAFTDIQGSYSDQASTTLRGYMFYFSRWPDSPSLPWATATLHSPLDINGGNDITQCWNQLEGWRRTLNFYCGGAATTPATPPAGTYEVDVTPKTFTFGGVTPPTIDPDLDGVFVPVVKLALDGSGKITLLDWQWWTKEAGAWVQPTTSEVRAALREAEFSIGRTLWAGDPATDRVRGKMGLTASGSIVPPAQSFTPGALRIGCTDRAGTHYGFEWR